MTARNASLRFSGACTEGRYRPSSAHRQTRKELTKVRGIEWMRWAIHAFQAPYGYEFQGDNLLLAHVNMMMPFAEYPEAKWHRKPAATEGRTIVNITAWKRRFTTRYMIFPCSRSTPIISFCVNLRLENSYIHI